MFGKDAFGVVPGAGRRTVHGRIGIENAAPVGIKRLRALVRREQAHEIIAEIGIEQRQRFEECALQLCPRAEEGRAQHDAADPLRMGLRIGQRQRRAPGAADHHPAFEAECFADQFHVGDQMRQRIFFAAALGTAATGAALIEQDSVEAFRIEQPPMIGLAAAAGAAMQIDRGDATGAADALDIDFVAIADRQQLRGQRRERIGTLACGFAGLGVRRHVRRPSPACPRRNCDR